MIFTFSPNWYKPQCLHFDQKTLYYCSNYLLYQYDLTLKTVQRQVCFRQLAMEYRLNHRDIKISAIASTERRLLVGVNQAYLFELDIQSLQVSRVTTLKEFESVEYIHPYKDKGNDAAILCNKDGSMLKFLLNAEDSQLQKIDHRHKSSAVKAIYQVNKHHCAVFTRGTILLYNQDFTQLQKIVQVSSHDTVFSVDCLQHQQRTFFCFLTKNKEAHTVTVFQFQIQQQFPLQKKKRVDQIGINIHQFYVHLHYPKQMAQKLKNNQKACLTLKFLTPQQLILTGKFGQISTLNTTSIPPNHNLTIRPYSNNEQNPHYQMWADSKHYKQIYAIYRHQQRLYLVSTDHNMTVWQLNNYGQQNIAQNLSKLGQNAPKYVYSLKFLTSSVQSLFFAQNDPRTVYALLRDSAIRSFAPLQQGSHQLNQYWKFSRKYKIKKAVCHPFQAGVLGLVTQCRRIQLYDIFQDRLMKLIQVGEQILNISFEYPCIHKELQAMFGCQFKQQKCDFLSFSEKEMQGKTVLLVQSQKYISVIQGLSEKEVTCWKSPRDKRLQRIHDNRYWDRRMLLATHTKNNVLSLFFRVKQTNINEFQLPLKYQQARTLFKSEPKSNEIIVVNFKGPKLAVFRVAIKAAGCQLIFSSQVSLQHLIDYLHLNYKDWRTAIYSQRDDCLTLLHLNRLVDQKYEISKSSDQAQLYSISSKLDVLSFYLEEYLVVATKDQSIKMIRIEQLQEWKRITKKKGPQTIQVQEQIE